MQPRTAEVFDLGTPKKKHAVDEDMVLFGAAVKSATFLRCFSITEHVYLGLGPSITRPGREVRGFIGGRVPFVVRPAVPNVGFLPHACIGSVYNSVGDCFVQGTMDVERIVLAKVFGEES